MNQVSYSFQPSTLLTAAADRARHPCPLSLSLPAPHKPLSTSLLSPASDAPIMHIRLRAVWNEGAHPHDGPDPTAALSRAEEGRAPEGVV